MKNIIKLDSLDRAIDGIPTKAGHIAVRFFKERFVYKNWLDSSRQSWKPTRKRTGSTLVATGTLKRSIRIVSKSHKSVIIGTDVLYAKIHNEGGNIKTTQSVRSHARKRKGRTHNVKAHSRQVNITIPQRQFMGQSTFLNTKIERMMKLEIIRAIDNG